MNEIPFLQKCFLKAKNSRKRFGLFEETFRFYANERSRRMDKEDPSKARICLNKKPHQLAGALLNATSLVPKRLLSKAGAYLLSLVATRKAHKLWVKANGNVLKM